MPLELIVPNLVQTAPADVQAADSGHVLIVDDVEQNLLAMRALLEGEGYPVLTASSGPEALENLLEHDVAVALLDVQMPDMDGFALAELMRGSQRTRDVPILFLTASPQDPVRSFKGYDAGAVDFLHKPIDARIITSKVKVFVELFRQRQLLAARNDQLERALKLNETMMAVLGHDLRTPLSVVHICAHALGGPVSDEDARECVQRIQAASARMTRMIDQLLEFSRIRTGGLRLHATSSDLGRIAEQAAEEIRRAHPSARIELEQQGDLVGDFDTDRMAQVFSNLLLNAVTHAPGQVVRARLEGHGPEEVRFVVANPGDLPDGLLPRLFEPFKGAFHKTGGLGLGLYIVDQFVQAHGGRTFATSAEGVVEIGGTARRTR